MKFNINSPVFQFLNTLSGYILLNIIFLLTCLPIITIGAAVTSLYQIMIKEAKKEHGYLIRNYFKAMKENFKQSTTAFLFLLITGLVLLFNMSFWATYGGAIGAIALFIVTFVFLMLMFCALYTFPLLACFKNTMIQTLKNAYFISITNKKTTFFILLFHILAIILCIYTPYARIFMLVLGFTFLTFSCSILHVKALKDYIPQ